MSQRDVELAHEAFAALADRGVEGLLPFIHEDFEMRTPVGMAAEPDTYVGPDGVRRWFESFDDVMDDVRLDPVRILDGGEGRALVELVLRARGGTTGIEVGQRVFTAFHSLGGQLTSLEFFVEPGDAEAEFERVAP